MCLASPLLLEQKNERAAPLLERAETHDASRCRSQGASRSGGVQNLDWPRALADLVTDIDGRALRRRAWRSGVAGAPAAQIAVLESPYRGMSKRTPM